VLELASQLALGLGAVGSGSADLGALGESSPTMTATGSWTQQPSYSSRMDCSSEEELTLG
jgi:hypothetical protein